jgi:hypothetical protein
MVKTWRTLSITIISDKLDHRCRIRMAELVNSYQKAEQSTLMSRQSPKVESEPMLISSFYCLRILTAISGSTKTGN